MLRLITISGLSYTGKTCFSNKLAASLNWEYISAGQRFRDLCKEKNIPIDSIPEEFHLNLDNTIKKELLIKNNTIMEGRYLGFFSQGIQSVLKILLISDYEKRIQRCYLRDNKILELKDAESVINKRDEKERSAAYNLYNVYNFDDKSYYDEIVVNNDLYEFQKGLKRIINLIHHL
jgi:cytidylate kinase